MYYIDTLYNTIQHIIPQPHRPKYWFAANNSNIVIFFFEFKAFCHLRIICKRTNTFIWKLSLWFIFLGKVSSSICKCLCLSLHQNSCKLWFFLKDLTIFMFSSFIQTKLIQPEAKDYFWVSAQFNNSFLFKPFWCECYAYMLLLILSLFDNQWIEGRTQYHNYEV